MLNLVIAIIALLIWSSIGIYYFRTPLTHWFDNRFGKDPVLPEPDEDNGLMQQENQKAPEASVQPPNDKAS